MPFQTNLHNRNSVYWVTTFDIMLSISRPVEREDRTMSRPHSRRARIRTLRNSNTQQRDPSERISRGGDELTLGNEKAGTHSAKRALFFVAASWAVNAAGASGSGAAPNALVGAGAMAVLARGRMDAARAIRRRAAPLAVLLVVTVFVLVIRRMDAAGTIA